MHKSDQNQIRKFKRVVILHCKGGSPERNFIPWLKSELEKQGLEVQVPKMPNTSEPNDEEQTNYVIENCTLDEHTLVLGHSFGGIVALRLLERGIKFAALVLAGTPYTGKFVDGVERATVTAAINKGFDFETIKSNVQRIELVFDTDDHAVAVTDGEAYSEKLGVPLTKVQANNSHFGAEEEPELLKAILHE